MGNERLECKEAASACGASRLPSALIQNISGITFLTGFAAVVSPSPVVSFLLRPSVESYGSTREIVTGSTTVRVPGDRRLLALGGLHVLRDQRFCQQHSGADGADRDGPEGNCGKRQPRH